MRTAIFELERIIKEAEEYRFHNGEKVEFDFSSMNKPYPGRRQSSSCEITSSGTLEIHIGEPLLNMVGFDAGMVGVDGFWDRYGIEREEYTLRATTNIKRAMEILFDMQRIVWKSRCYKDLNDPVLNFPGEKFVFTVHQSGEKKGFFTEEGIKKEMTLAMGPAFGEGAVLVKFGGVEVYCSRREAWAFNLETLEDGEKKGGKYRQSGG